MRPTVGGTVAGPHGLCQRNTREGLHLRRVSTAHQACARLSAVAPLTRRPRCIAPKQPQTMQPPGTLPERDVIEIFRPIAALIRYCRPTPLAAHRERNTRTSLCHFRDD